MLVMDQVLSIKTKRPGVRSDWLSNHAQRRFRMSGRSCSAAWAVFYGTARPLSIGRRIGWEHKRGRVMDKPTFAVLGIDLGKTAAASLGSARPDA
jgi:hypothetical protein